MGVLPPNYLSSCSSAQYQAQMQAARYNEAQAASQRGLSEKPRAGLVVTIGNKPVPRKTQSSRGRMVAERKETIEKERRADNLFDLSMIGAVVVLAVLYALGWLK